MIKRILVVLALTFELPIVFGLVCALFFGCAAGDKLTVADKSELVVLATELQTCDAIFGHTPQSPLDVKSPAQTCKDRAVTSWEQRQRARLDGGF